MVQPLINFSFNTSDEFLEFIKKLRSAGVLKFADNGVSLDLTPGRDEEITNLELDEFAKKLKIQDALKTAKELEKEDELNDLWST